MRIESIHISNFRSFEDETVVLEDLTTLVGPNGSGKSTVLAALNLFFSATDDVPTDLRKLDREDFHQGNTENEIEITITFSDLSDDAKKELSHYVRDSKLVVAAVAEFDQPSERATVKQYGYRNVVEQFRIYFEREKSSAKVDVLKETYAEIRSQFTDLADVKTRSSMTEALRGFEADHPELCKLARSQDEFYGAANASGVLRPYLEWVYIPAVKDASVEGSQVNGRAFKQLIDRGLEGTVGFDESIAELKRATRESYDELMESRKDDLTDLEEKLGEQLRFWATDTTVLELGWNADPGKSVRIDPPSAGAKLGEGEFLVSVARQGHGLQRSYIVALLQLLAENDEGARKSLILGFEEPELYQHPPKIRQLDALLRSLARQGSQVVATTHSPQFVAGDQFEQVRLVRRPNGSGPSKVTGAIATEIEEKLKAAFPEGMKASPTGTPKFAQALYDKTNEMFFADRVIFVEGPEDAAYMAAWIDSKDLVNKFDAAGWHIVPVNKKSQMPRLVTVAQSMGIPCYAVFDSDSDCDDRYRSDHERDNRALLRLMDAPDLVPFPDEPVIQDGFACWPNSLGDTVNEEVKNSLGEKELDAVLEEVRADLGHARNIDKNSMFISLWLSRAVAAGGNSPSLECLFNKLLD